MEKYIEAELVEIVEDQIVVLDGVKYLVLGKLSESRYKKPEVKAEPKPKKKPKSARLTPEKRDQIDAGVFSILNANPNSKSGYIRTVLKDQFGISADSSMVSNSLTRLKKKDLVEVQGLKHLATWSVKPVAFTGLVSSERH